MAAGSGLYTSSNLGLTFVNIATDRTAGYQYLDRSKNVLIATSDAYDNNLYWAGSAGTFAASLNSNSTAAAGKSFTLLLKQAAATGNGTAVFQHADTTAVKWAESTAPTITATAGTMDILSFVSDGTKWYGSFVQNFTP